MNKYTVVNGNTNKVCEFDSHTTTNNTNKIRSVLDNINVNIKYERTKN